MISSEQENITSSRSICESLGGTLAYYNKILIDYVFTFGEKNNCLFTEGVFINSNVEKAKCYYFVFKDREKIIKDFICTDKMNKYFICQILKKKESTIKTIYKYSTAVIKTVSTIKDTTLKKNEKPEEKNYYYFYLILILTITGFVLLSIAAVACLVSNGNFCLFIKI